jgi:catechol 2,3-dioxygenase
MGTVTESGNGPSTAIHPRTRLGPVELTVADLDRLVPFYETYLGLRLVRRGEGMAEMGAGGAPLLRLMEQPGARRVRGATGLYHYAVLVPSRRELARVIARLISLRYPNHPTDHLMTETTYLDDPEGNGIEVYVDTPEDGVFSFAGGNFEARDALGNARSGRDPLDLDELFRNLSPDDELQSPMPSETRMGHIHLHVADLAEAVRFYHAGLGFDTMGLAPAFQAAFLSAGGYHHHVGVNTWMGEGAPAPSPGSLGLRHFTVIVPDAAEVMRVAARLRAQDFASSPHDGGLLARDPSGNVVLVVPDREG